MAKKKPTDALMEAVMGGFKAAGLKDAEESVTTIAKYWEDMKWIN